MSRVLTPEEVDQIEKLRLCNLPVDVIEDLIVTVRALRSRLTTCERARRADHKTFSDDLGELRTDRDRLRAKLDRVRALPCFVSGGTPKPGDCVCTRCLEVAKALEDE